MSKGWASPVCAAILCLALGAFGQAAEQPYYKGKTIRLIVPYPPGGGSDIFARLVAQNMPEHIPGEPTIIVQNVPGGSAIIGMNYLYNIAKPDGLTFGHTSVQGIRDQLLGSPGVKFDYAKFDYVGNGGPQYQLFAIRADLPYKSLEDLKKAEKPLFVAAQSQGSTPSILARLLAHEGYKAKAVYGYQGTGPSLQAVLAGEADATMLVSHQAIRVEDKIRPLFWVAEKSPPWMEVPNLQELPFTSTTRSFVTALTAPATLARAFLAPPQTRRDALGILQKAFEETAKDPEFIAQAEKIQVPVQWKNAADTKALYMQVLTMPPQAAAAFKKLMEAR